MVLPGDCPPPGVGGGVDCASVWCVPSVLGRGCGGDAFVLMIQVHLGNCFPSYETSEKVVLFGGIR